MKHREKQELTLSMLPHTWLFDIDGTIVKHNGYKIDGCDSILPGVLELFKQIPQGDTIILLTSREEKYRKITESFLKNNHIRYDYLIFNLPFGERILINDNKPSGLSMSHAICLERNAGMNVNVIIDQNL